MTDNNPGWHLRTRVVLPERPRRAVAHQTGNPTDCDDPFAVASDPLNGARAYFVRDVNDGWHRVSKADFDLMYQLWDDAEGSLSLKPDEAGETLDVWDGDRYARFCTLYFLRSA